MPLNTQHASSQTKEMLCFGVEEEEEDDDDMRTVMKSGSISRTFSRLKALMFSTASRST